jgi:hypothetical protein
MVLLSILLRLAAVCRLTIPLLYAMVVPTVFRGWYLAYTALAEGIWFVLLALVLLSWAVSLIRRVIDFVGEYRTDREAMELFASRVRQARANGEASVSTEGLWV